MIRTLVALAALAAFFAGRPVQAQYVQPQVSPYGSGGISPYLNLLRGGSPAANYYLGVIPEVERRNNAAQFAAGINDLYRRSEAPLQEATEEILPTLQPTGHAVQFGNYSGYFGSSGFGTTRPQQQAQQPLGAAPRRR